MKANFFEFTEEQLLFKSEVDRFVDNEIRPHAREWDKLEKSPIDVFKKWDRWDGCPRVFLKVWAALAALWIFHY